MNIPYRDMVPHARRLRGGRISVPFQTYFLTKCIEDRRPILAVPAAAEIVIQSLADVRAKGEIKLLAFVIMPDHYHAVLSILPVAGTGTASRKDIGDGSVSGQENELSNLMRHLCLVA